MEYEAFCAGGIVKKCSQGKEDHSCGNHVHCESGRCQNYECTPRIPLNNCDETCNSPSDCESEKCPVTGNLKQHCADENGKQPKGCNCITSDQCATGRCDDFECKDKLELDERCRGDTGTYNLLFNGC